MSFPSLSLLGMINGPVGMSLILGPLTGTSENSSMEGPVDTSSFSLGEDFFLPFWEGVGSLEVLASFWFDDIMR